MTWQFPATKAPPVSTSSRSPSNSTASLSPRRVDAKWEDGKTNFKQMVRNFDHYILDLGLESGYILEFSSLYFRIGFDDFFYFRFF